VCWDSQLLVECSVQRIAFLAPREEFRTMLRVVRVLGLEFIGVDSGPNEVPERPSTARFVVSRSAKTSVRTHSTAFRRTPLARVATFETPKESASEETTSAISASGRRATTALTFSIPAFEAATL